MVIMKSVSAVLGISLIGSAGGMAIVAFFALPWLSLGPFGDYTAAKVTQFAQPELHTQQLACLWLAVLFPLIAVICAFLSLIVPGQRRFLALLVIVFGIVALSGAIGLYVLVSRQNILSISLARFIGSGFRVYTASVTLVAIGGAVQLAGSRRKAMHSPERDYRSSQRPERTES